MLATSGIVLAGGASRRMGTDKRLIQVDGAPMLRRVADAVNAAIDELIVVVSARDPLPGAVLRGLGARMVVDRRTDAGPLAGLEAGLVAARCERVIAVAGDMPWLEPALLRRLLAHLDRAAADAVAVATDRGREPLLAAYRRSPALAAATLLLDAGERRLGSLLDRLRVTTVIDPAGRSAVNVNEPADLLAVER
ncbi:MAG: molybdenum cofactor guanylyltransferase [Chloroflexota bacterium]